MSSSTPRRVPWALWRERWRERWTPHGGTAWHPEARLWHGRPGAGPGRESFVSFAEAVTATVRAHAATGDFRVFSPDELTSNRLDQLAER